MRPSNTACCFHPGVLFLFLTLVVTSAATALLCIAMMTEHWEYVTWNKEKLSSIEQNLTAGSSDLRIHGLEWLLDGQVARVLLESKYFQGKQSQNSKKVSSQEAKGNNNLPALFFAPIHGGIWTYCISLNRMQNLSISCALVCLIILSSSALIGTFGVLKRQNSAILLTGVMYLLAAIFATFSFTILNFKRNKNKLVCLNTSIGYNYAIEGVIVSATALDKAYSLHKLHKYFEARIFTTGYSFKLGWGGIGICVLVSILWILLSKSMRFNSTNALFLVL